MKVKELIAKLQELDGELPVVFESADRNGDTQFENVDAVLSLDLMARAWDENFVCFDSELFTRVYKDWDRIEKRFYNVRATCAVIGTNYLTGEIFTTIHGA